MFTVKSHNALVKHLKLMQNHEDFEIKKLLINILVLLSQDQATLPVCHNSNMIRKYSQIKKIKYLTLKKYVLQ